ncbi:MAG TPA: SPOR domain-containing protein [Solimonas sp.]
MNEQLKHRLIGALVLLAVALLMAFLLPKPGHVERDDGVRRVTIDLDGGTSSPVAQGDRGTPPVIAAPAPGDESASAGDPVEALDGEPEIDESGLAAGEEDGRMAAAPVAIRPSDTLAQAAPGRVLPAPGKAPPVQLKQDDRLQGLPNVTPPPQQAAVAPVAKPPVSVPVPAQPEIAARPKLEPPVARTPVEAPAAKPPAPVAPPQPKLDVAAAKPVPAPAAKPAEPAKPAGKARWSVQVGSYAALENARIAETKLKAAGLPTQFGPVDTAKGVLYRVRVGPLADEAAAQAAKAKAVQAGFAQATIRTD